MIFNAITTFKFQQDQDNEEETNCQDLVRNTNALDVAAAARERRENARLEAQRKKEKDKEDRYVLCLLVLFGYEII